MLPKLYDELTTSASGYSKTFLGTINHCTKCKVTVNPASKKAGKTLTVSADTLSVYVGKSKTLTAKVGSKKKTVKWSSKDSSIARVDRNGKVTGVKQGTTTVYAKYGKQTVKVTVNRT